MNIVFDIGGTKLRVARAIGGVLEDVQKIATPQDAEEGLAALVTLIETVASGHPIDAIAGGVPGIVKEGTLVTIPHLPEWNGLRLAARLTEHFGVPTHVENDASLAALGEARFGAGKGTPIVAYLTVSTGLGGARVVDGIIDRSAQGFEPGFQIIDTQTGTTFGQATHGAALAEKCGAPAAELPRSAYDTATPFLATGIWNTIMLWSPDVVVLGGSLMNEENGYRLQDVTNALAQVRDAAYLQYVLPPIKHAALGDENGLYGAAALLNAQV